jgi:hypothetical protein
LNDEDPECKDRTCAQQPDVSQSGTLMFAPEVPEDSKRTWARRSSLIKVAFYSQAASLNLHRLPQLSGNSRILSLKNSVMSGAATDRFKKSMS